MKVLLIGDSCTDVYVYGDVKRLNPEAPVPILEPKREQTSQGMAWNVFNNLNAFGVDVDMVTNEETIIKTRYVDEKSNQQILRVDEEGDVEKLELEFTNDGMGDYDALVISDYNKGFITQEQLIELSSRFVGPVFVDTKKKTIPEGVFVKINEIEFEKLEHYNSDNLIITRGGKGTEYRGKLYPAEKVNVFDVVGAGDTFLAALTFGYLSHLSVEKAIPIANKAASIAVSHTGTYVLTEEDINEILF
jgi:D-beta-D-heptose 7-phosphate kinase/D-beta-D-heptose 1-phosphate adenosyltransferase